MEKKRPSSSRSVFDEFERKAEKPVKTRKTQPKIEKPAIPDYLDAIARKKWIETIEKIESLGINKRIDGDILGLYATAFSDFLKFRKLADDYQKKLDFERENTDFTNLQQRKAIELLENSAMRYVEKQNRAMHIMMLNAEKLGLSISSRKRMKMDDDQEKNPFAEFLKK